LQSLAPTPVSRRVDVRQPVVKIIAESLSQHDEKHVEPTCVSSCCDEKTYRFNMFFSSQHDEKHVEPTPISVGKG
jgi:hypothetical protein